MNKKTIEQRYKKLTHREHVIKKPGMYIGSIQTEETKMFVFEDINKIKEDKFTYKDVDYNAGFVKLFDEVLTNASDHSIRTNKVKYIKIIVEKDFISIENDGPGIPVKTHKEHKIYVPELIFGHLLSGENFDDDDQRMVGGTHGLGVKLTNIFSKKFIIETADGKKKFKQTFSNNLLKKSKPTISKSKRNYTKITFYPDFERFEMSEIDDEVQSVLLKRTIDVAAYNPKVKIFYNKTLIPIRSFKDYVKKFTDDEVIYEKIDDNWEVGICKTQIDVFQHVSMVNGVSTINGGTHVNYISNTISRVLKEKLDRTNKDLNIKQSFIKNHLFAFVSCRIPNPLFDTQTKDSLKSNIRRDIELSDAFYKKVLSSGIKDDILDFVTLKTLQDAKRQTGQNSRKTRLKIDKLYDANKAGTSQSMKCSLFLTEGDSAAATAKRGFSVTGVEYFGLFPLKGKPLNVKKVTLHKMRLDKEISNIISALGLEIGKRYSSTRTLRYGKVVIMTDQDHDGSHIKGLIINLFETHWPELLELDFLYEFITPIIKAKKSNRENYFYTLNEYRRWKEKTGPGWFIKYYKGLGTIEPKEAKQFFRDINKHLIKFNSKNIKREREYVDLLFNQKRADDRKEWLLTYVPGVEVDKFKKKQSYESFFDNEFKDFSIANNIRTIPSMVDGLKPSQRKVLYTLFKRNFKNEVKVELLTGSILELASYHHGPKSLEDTIIGMAQDFVGSNNINLLEPTGEFGTREKGGKNASASRYIFTKLMDVTRNTFIKEDDDLLEYLEDDGFSIEPKFYVPIVPMALINGADGIGTGWSSFIPKFNPHNIITWIENKLKGRKRNIKFDPWYKGFNGEMVFDEKNNRYITKGIINRENDSWVVSELPIGMWNDRYSTLLDKNENIAYHVDDSTDSQINIEIKTDEPISNLHLETYLSVNNFILFDESGKIKKYNDQYEILEEFYEIRLRYYDLRKQFIINKLEEQKDNISNRIKFIKAIINKKILINNKPKSDIIIQIEKNKIGKYNDSYDYLLNMSLLQLTKEKVDELNNQYKKKQEELTKIKLTTIESMWRKDLSNLKKLI